MNNQLVAVQNNTIGNESVQTVNARELHEFLEVGKFFANWIKDRIEKYGFTQDVDFVVIADSGKNSEGRPRLEYFITLDMAKELSMVERNDKGKQARQYFIQCEKRLSQPQLPDFTNPIEMARAWADGQEQLMIEKQRAAELEESFGELANVHSSIQFAMSMQYDDINLSNFSDKTGFSMKDIKWKLHEAGIVEKPSSTGGTGSLRPYKKSLDAGLFNIRETVYGRSFMFTRKGMAVCEMVLNGSTVANASKLWRQSEKLEAQLNQNQAQNVSAQAFLGTRH